MADFERTFDKTAMGYDRSRPFYVNDLLRDIFCYHAIGPESHVLEIGMGTGKATLPFLETGCRLTGIEPGAHMAEVAKERCGQYENFWPVLQTLQEFEYPSESFDLVFSATAFHWIPEELGYPKVFDLLKSGGAFARFAYHAGADKGRKEMTSEIQAQYALYMKETGKPKEFSMEDAQRTAMLANKYGFADIRYSLYHTTRDFTADEYMDLLKTYPNHMALDAEKREKLFSGIHAAIQKYGGIITVYYTMDLELAKKP